MRTSAIVPLPRLVQRLTGPNAMSANQLAREVGIHQATLSRWLRAAATLQPMSKKDPKVPPPTSWTAEQKLAAVLEATTLSDEALGAWLRRKGLHAEQLANWRAAALASSEGGTRSTATKAPPARRLRELERELRRKDKALTEAAALLVLQKTI